MDICLTITTIIILGPFIAGVVAAIIASKGKGKTAIDKFIESTRILQSFLIIPMKSYKSKRKKIRQSIFCILVAFGVIYFTGFWAYYQDIAALKIIFSAIAILYIIILVRNVIVLGALLGSKKKTKAKSY
ncbi:MAG: hypothetical protein JSW00_03965 [Thermoplasmata archaeon]|nr:MAG: hypothetical protein JSW00_03965 [Thermoplasmata archaeon]